VLDNWSAAMPDKLGPSDPTTKTAADLKMSLPD